MGPSSKIWLKITLVILFFSASAQAVDCNQAALLPQIAKPPAIIQSYLEDTGLDWFKTSIELPKDEIDPFFILLASLQESKEVVLGAGSDVVQVLLGVPKRLWTGSAEVNLLVSKPDFAQGGLNLFRAFPGGEVPAFKERSAMRVDLIRTNAESSSDLERLVENGRRGNYLMRYMEDPNVPLKQTAVAIIDADGKGRLYFRTSEDFSNYVHKILTLPDVRSTDSEDWLAHETDQKSRQIYRQGVLVYAAVVYTRGKAKGWTLDEPSRVFLIENAAHLNKAEKTEVIGVVESQVNGPREIPFIPRVLAELGLTP